MEWLGTSPLVRESKFFCFFAIFSSKVLLNFQWFRLHFPFFWFRNEIICFKSWYGSVIVNMLVPWLFHTWFHTPYCIMAYFGSIVELFKLDYQCRIRFHFELDWWAFEFGLLSYSLESGIRLSLHYLDLFELTTLELSKCSISSKNLESFVKLTAVCAVSEHA